ncbi:cytochrome-c peroxidase [Croceimicrobium sp.]|uniref:cytochrome-c peroxidase n=1 Tax=Croceimicrobium sp. TaxID=2828340 RepID=UPI003BAAC28C
MLSLIAFKADRTKSESWPLPELYFFPPLPAEFKVPSKAQVELGRYLFYDPILSANSKVSCATCHKQEFAFADRGKRFSLGVAGQKLDRNSPGLFNLIWQQSFFWDGRASSLQEQAFFPVRHSLEMNLKWSEAENRIRQSALYPALFELAYPGKEIDSSLICQALADFQSILFSQDSKYDRVLRGEDHFTALEYQGYTLVNLQDKGDCMQCHITDAHALGTTGDFSNNGLDSAQGPMDYVDKGQIEFRGQDRNGWFKIPSLRNVALTAPYMHDGRFETLEEVIDFYSEGLAKPYNVDSKLQHAHKGGVHLTNQEKKAILAFLHTLSDSVFIQNPAYSNPFSN